MKRLSALTSGLQCFNEAAGFTQRKLVNTHVGRLCLLGASMRPPVLPSGNKKSFMSLFANVASLQ